MWWFTVSRDGCRSDPSVSMALPAVAVYISMATEGPPSQMARSSSVIAQNSTHCPRKNERGWLPFTGRGRAPRPGPPTAGLAPTVRMRRRRVAAHAVAAHRHRRRKARWLTRRVSDSSRQCCCVCRVPSAECRVPSRPAPAPALPFASSRSLLRCTALRLLCIPRVRLLCRPCLCACGRAICRAQGPPIARLPCCRSLPCPLPPRPQARAFCSHRDPPRARRRATLPSQTSPRGFALRVQCFYSLQQ
jgi:hypothetical protein